jgi:hypothetical protein
MNPRIHTRRPRPEPTSHLPRHQRLSRFTSGFLREPTERGQRARLSRL